MKIVLFTLATLIFITNGMSGMLKNDDKNYFIQRYSDKKNIDYANDNSNRNTNYRKSSNYYHPNLMESLIKNNPAFIIEMLQSQQNPQLPQAPKKEEKPAKEDEKQECSICFDGMAAAPVQILACMHKFHKHCISKWLSNNPTCPLCRANNSVEKSKQ